MKLIKLLKEKKIPFEIKENRLIVYGKVDLSHTQIEGFPNCSITFLDNVDLSHTHIKEFPNCSIVFYEDVDLSHTQIEEFPNCSIVFLDNVDLSHTHIKEFSNCSITFSGDVNLSHTHIKELPDNIIVKLFLDTDGTSITKIPKKLKAYRIYIPVKGRFNIYIEKNGIIGIDGDEKSISEWKEFFKERRPFINYPNLTLEQYDIVEQDFKTAVKLYESWNS